MEVNPWPFNRHIFGGAAPCCPHYQRTKFPHVSMAFDGVKIPRHSLFLRLKKEREDDYMGGIVESRPSDIYIFRREIVRIMDLLKSINPSLKIIECSRSLELRLEMMGM